MCMQASLNPNITKDVRKNMLLAMTEYKLERKCEAQGFIMILSIFLKRKKTIILSKPTYFGMYGKQSCKMNVHLIRQIAL